MAWVYLCVTRMKVQSLYQMNSSVILHFQTAGPTMLSQQWLSIFIYWGRGELESSSLTNCPACPGKPLLCFPCTGTAGSYHACSAFMRTVGLLTLISILMQQVLYPGSHPQPVNGGQSSSPKGCNQKQHLRCRGSRTQLSSLSKQMGLPRLITTDLSSGRS